MISNEVMQAAQAFTLGALALWLLARFAAPYTRMIRTGVLALYLLGAVGFVLVALIG